MNLLKKLQIKMLKGIYINYDFIKKVLLIKLYLELEKLSKKIEKNMKFHIISIEIS